MKPLNEAQVVDAVREARERRRTLEIASGGTRRGFGRPIACDDVLDMSGLSGIVTYEPEELILTVKPATPLAEIGSVLAAKNQRLGFEPQDWRALLGSQGTPTIAGAVAANANGSAAMRFGRARDHLLGFRAVNGFGEAYKAGGRVVKNVTGFDLPKLMCGAMGTLGPMTELTFRVFPKAERVRHFAVRQVEARVGFDLLRRIGSSPLEATGLAYRWLGHARLGNALIRLEGSREALAEKAAMLQALCDRDVVQDDGMTFAEIASGRMFENLARGPMVESDASDVWRLDASRAVAAPSFGRAWIGDWAGRRHWVLETPGISRADIARKAGGTEIPLMLMRASEATRRRAQVFPVQGAALARLTRAVKAAFDPLGLFNPGRMFEGV